MKRVNRGSIREVSLKFQEKEKDIKIENKLSDFIINVKAIDIDSETYEMLKENVPHFSFSLLNFKINNL